MFGPLAELRVQLVEVAVVQAETLYELPSSFDGFESGDEVVGGSDLAGDQTSHAFLWAPAAKMQDLGTVQDAVDNDTFSVGLGINDAGHIVGVSSNADSSIIRGFIRQNGKLVDLNSLVSGNTPLYARSTPRVRSSGSPSIRTQAKLMAISQPRPQALRLPPRASNLLFCPNRFGIG